jgi:hypothetical protein
MPRKIVNKSVQVEINPANTRKIIRAIKKTHRSFAAEVNMAVEQYKPMVRYVDNGK